jgi:hypothetical protein
MGQSYKSPLTRESARTLRHDIKGRLSLITLTCGLLKLSAKDTGILARSEKVSKLAREINSLVEELFPKG